MIFLVFKGNELEIHGYLDINSQSDIDDRKSQPEYIFTQCYLDHYMEGYIFLHYISLHIFTQCYLVYN